MKAKRFIFLILLPLLVLAGCSNNQPEPTEADNTSLNDSEQPETFTVGVTSDFNREIWEDIGHRLKTQNIDLEIKEFSDFIQPNIAVDEGSVDAVTYEYTPFLIDTNYNHGLDLIPIGYAQITPLGIWAPKSKPLDKLEDVADGSTVAIGNDPVNMDHELRVFEELGLISLTPDEQQLYTTDDITDNPHNLNFKPIDTASMMSYVDDVDLFITGASVAGTADYEPEDALFVEDPKDVSDDFKLTFVVRAADKDNPLVKKVLSEYQSEATAEAMDRITNGKFVPGWDADNLAEDNQHAYEHFQELTENYQSENN